ncbi:MAG: hypothetical protein R6U13_00980 [Desulfatiglandaceae bacterium]
MNSADNISIQCGIGKKYDRIEGEKIMPETHFVKGDGLLIVDVQKDFESTCTRNEKNSVEFLLNGAQ